MKLKELWIKVRDNLCAMIVSVLPDRLIYFAVFRVGVCATTGQWERQNVQELLFSEALVRFEELHKLEDHDGRPKFKMGQRVRSSSGIIGTIDKYMRDTELQAWQYHFKGEAGWVFEDSLSHCFPLDEALDIADRFAQIDGDYHRLWVIDQMIRVLLGDKYEEWVKEYEVPGEYTWDTGIAP